MSFTIKDLMNMSADILDLTPDGWERPIWFDMSKLAEEIGEIAETLNKTSKTKVDTGHEISDALAVLCVIALKMNIDLDEASKEKQKERIQKLLRKFHEGKVPEGFTFRLPL